MTDIGQLIKSVFDQSGMSIAEFSRRINVSRSNVYNIFAKADIGVQQLQLISEALNHDFLADLSPKSANDANNYAQWAKKEQMRKEQLRQKASAYLSEKRRRPFYSVTLRTEFRDNVSYLFCLPKEVITKLRSAILGESEDDPFQLYDWNSVTYDSNWAYGEVSDVISIDFTPVYCYGFMAGYCRDQYDEFTTIPFQVILTDEQYTELLAYHLEDRQFTPQRLKRLNPALYDVIVYNIPWWIDETGKSSLFFMTEFQNDAERILGECDLGPETIFSHIDKYYYRIEAEFQEGRFRLYYEGDDTKPDGVSRIECNATDAKKVLGASSYREAIKILRDRYSVPDVIDQFDKLLRDYLNKKN